MITERAEAIFDMDRADPGRAGVMIVTPGVWFTCTDVRLTPQPGGTWQATVPNPSGSALSATGPSATLALLHLAAAAVGEDCTAAAVARTPPPGGQP